MVRVSSRKMEVQFLLVRPVLFMKRCPFPQCNGTRWFDCAAPHICEMLLKMLKEMCPPQIRALITLDNPHTL